jgi:hypothetical protein
MFTLTLKQYTKTIWQGFKKDYPDVTRQDFTDSYTQDQLRIMWFEEVARQAKEKNYPSRLIMDKLFYEAVNPAMFWSFIRHNDIPLPDGWINPQTRAWRKENRLKPRYME